jgi:hypothetical protein
MRGGGGVQLGMCVGVVSGGATSGCEGFDAVNEELMMQPLDIVRMELCNYAICIDACF